MKAIPDLLARRAQPRGGDEGVFEGYASLFGAEDQGRDIVMPGAFGVSLARTPAAKVRMLFQHDPAQPIGVWETIREDGRGLHVRGRLTLGVARAREILALIREGALDGLSIGFRARKAVRDARTGLRRLHEIDLWEISLVTFPMLPSARVSAISKQVDAGCAEEIAPRQRLAVKAASTPARPTGALASSPPAPPWARGKAPSGTLRGSSGPCLPAHTPARREARPGGGI